MISTVVRDYANAAESALFSLKTSESDFLPSSTGLRSLDNLYANQKKSNWKSYAATPVIALGNTLIETITPLLQTIESVVFASFSILATFYYLVRLDTRNAGKATKMTMINLNETIRNVVRSIGKVAISPLYLISQLLQVAQSNSVEQIMFKFEKEPPGTKKFIRFSETTPNCVFKHTEVALTLLGVLHTGVTKIAKVSPLAARVIAVFAASIDTLLHITTPLITAVDHLFFTSLAISFAFLIGLPSILITKEIKTFRHLVYNATFSLSYAIDSIAQTISMVVLAPLSLIGRTAQIVYDPMKPGYIERSIYTMPRDNLGRFQCTILTSKGFIDLSNANAI